MNTTRPLLVGQKLLLSALIILAYLAARVFGAT